MLGVVDKTEELDKYIKFKREFTDKISAHRQNTDERINDMLQQIEALKALHNDDGGGSDVVPVFHNGTNWIYS